MSDDLKKIKKLYGEGMMHFCRDYFSSILEEKRLLPDLLQKDFAPSHVLYEDLIRLNIIEVFKRYIYDLFYLNNVEVEQLDLSTPTELLKQVGYILYECKSEADIQCFKKYYAKGESLCTFNGGRLNTCHVFFAVRNDVDEIKRENFPNPERQDEYGTSVISIQFSKDSSHILSIKNRYNHTVENPDATFGNNLENIVPGLTKSFEVTYGLKQEYKNYGFDLPGYVKANDGRWYKFNYEVDNIYYCIDNVIIDNNEIKKYDKERFIIMDYFVLDLTKKIIYSATTDSLINTIGKIKKVMISKKGKEKEIIIINENDEEIILIINEKNQIVGLKSKNLTDVGDWFLWFNKTLSTVDLPSLKVVGKEFLCWNMELTSLELPSIEQVGYNFLRRNSVLEKINLPVVQKIDKNFLLNNRALISLLFPKLCQVGNSFMYYNNSLVSIQAPLLQQVGDDFLPQNRTVKVLELPSLSKIGYDFFSNNLQLRFKILCQIDSETKLKR